MISSGNRGVKLIPPSFLGHLKSFLSDPVGSSAICDPVGSMRGPSSTNGGGGVGTKHLLINVKDRVSSMAELLEEYPVVGLSRDMEMFPHVCCESKTVFSESASNLFPSFLLVAIVEFDSGGYTVYIPFGSNHFFKAKRYTTNTTEG